MDFKKIFRSGKKEPFRAPREVAALRSKIDLESRENFPRLERFKELAREADAVYTQLSAIIALKEHAEEAHKVQDEIQKKMDALFAKIEGNMNGQNAVHGKDFVKSIDYLERKNIRNRAKTLYTEFLNLHERIITWCREGSPGSVGLLEIATTEIMQTISALNSDFFKIHVQDREIQDMKEQTLVRISGLIRILEENNQGLEEKGLAAAARTCELNLEKTLKELSAP